MCGILAVLGLAGDGAAAAERPRVVRLARRIRHRGPDWSGVRVQGDAVLAHERLAIVHPESGEQPIVRGAVALGVNGEIFNHEAVRGGLGLAAGQELSDCDVILDLYEARPSGTAAECAEWLRELNGMFAFCLHDASTGRYVVARDHMGIVPLYYGEGRDGCLWVASELKAIHDVCDEPRPFPPGHVLVHQGPGGAAVSPARWYTPSFYASKAPPEAPLDLDALRGAFEAAVRRQMMADVPYAVLLSGGLDSSLVAAVAARAVAPRKLHTFSVGLAGSPDLAAARRVAAHIGSEHHEVRFTIQEGLDALPEVVRHLETFDVTTIRAGTPMFLLSRAVRARGFKMVLSGEGSDEAFAGYLYFHRAPSREELHRETVDKLRDLHKYDCLRSNKAMAAFGVEARVPFLDIEFLEAAMGFDPAAKLCRDADGKRRMEKWALRAAFDAAERPYLPREVLWRQKEQFSDGVGTQWIDTLRDAQGLVSDERLAKAAARWAYATPRTKEGYLYRELFEESFPHESAARTVPHGDTIACSTAAATRWDPSFQGMLDPSGRAVRGVHEDAYEELKELE